jgi:radical SAM superfamily enzyme YgiQ (UPF0313 family)
MLKNLTKILFIVPMHITFDAYINPSSNSRHYRKADGKTYNSLVTDLPLGFMSMSAYIKKYENVDIRLIDLNVELNLADEFPFERFEDYCQYFLGNYDYDPDIIGISSLFSPSFYNFMDVAKVSKRIFPNAFVLGGGNIPSSMYKHIYSELNCDYFDALCYGEGEIPMLEFVRATDKKHYLDNNTSWITKENVSNNFIPSHNFLENLDEIPFYDYDLCDMEKHGQNPAMSALAVIENQKGFHIMTSRGCPFKCTFCASHKVHGRKMRYHSIDRVRGDFTRLKKEYGATTVIFQDDHLMGNIDRVYEILSIIGDLHLESVFQNGLTLYALDKRMLNAFYDAGVRQLVLPVESGSPKVLKHSMRKPLKLSISLRVADDCRELGIYTNTNILIGMPGETKEDIEEGRRNLRTIHSNWFHIVCASPLVGSEMNEIAVENNYLKGDTLGADYRKAVIETEDFTADYIQEMQYIMNLELNFVYNNDIRLGEYDLALKGLLNVIRVKSDHAFAYYYASLCYIGKKNHQKAEEFILNAIKYCQTDYWWKYIDYFELLRNNWKQVELKGLKLHLIQIQSTP